VVAVSEKILPDPECAIVSLVSCLAFRFVSFRFTVGHSPCIVLPCIVFAGGVYEKKPNTFQRLT